MARLPGLYIMLCMTRHRPVDHDVTILIWGLGAIPSPRTGLAPRLVALTSNLVSKEGQAILLFPRNE